MKIKQKVKGTGKVRLIKKNRRRDNMKIADGIFLIVLGILTMSFKAISYFDFFAHRKMQYWITGEQVEGTMTHEGRERVLEIYELSPIPTYIGIVLILWGVLKIGVELYGIKKHQQDSV